MGSYFFNLQKDLDTTAGGPNFVPPVAVPPPDRNTMGAVEISQFAFSETPSTADPLQRAADISFEIRISPRSTGFVDDNGLPDPAVRLHAMAAGRVTFHPADAEFGDRLVLEPRLLLYSELLSVSRHYTYPPWWKRWVESGNVPAEIIYENVDRQSVEAVLGNVPAPPRESGFTPRHHGVSFPRPVTDSTKAVYTTLFLSGPDPNLIVQPYVETETAGYFGVAASDPDDPDSADRVLRLHVRYSGHTATSPRIMGPRELLYLLFGDHHHDHVFLKAFAEAGLQDTAEPVSRRMTVRPPLRTWHRIRWEAEQEIRANWGTAHEPWAKAGSLGSSRFLNPLVHAHTYADGWKCNLFASEICFRAGYRIRIQPMRPESGGSFAHDFHYLSADQYGAAAEHGQNPFGTTMTPAVLKRGNTPWARRWDRHLYTDPDDASRARSPTDRRDRVNEMLIDESRCLVMVKQDLDANQSGHIAIVHRLGNDGKLVYEPDLSGLKELCAHLFEAKETGVKSRNICYTPYTDHPDEDLILFELVPGGDPDTKAGVEDLNVR